MALVDGGTRACGSLGLGEEAIPAAAPPDAGLGLRLLPRTPFRGRFPARSVPQPSQLQEPASGLGAVGVAWPRGAAGWGSRLLPRAELQACRLANLLPVFAPRRCSGVSSERSWERTGESEREAADRWGAVSSLGQGLASLPDRAGGLCDPTSVRSPAIGFLSLDSYKGTWKLRSFWSRMTSRAV